MCAPDKLNKQQDRAHNLTLTRRRGAAGCGPRGSGRERERERKGPGRGAGRDMEQQQGNQFGADERQTHPGRANNNTIKRLIKNSGRGKSVEDCPRDNKTIESTQQIT